MNCAVPYTNLKYDKIDYIEKSTQWKQLIKNTFV